MVVLKINLAALRVLCDWVYCRICGARLFLCYIYQNSGVHLLFGIGTRGGELYEMSTADGSDANGGGDGGRDKGTGGPLTAGHGKGEVRNVRIRIQWRTPQPRMLPQSVGRGVIQRRTSPIQRHRVLWRALPLGTHLCLRDHRLIYDAED